jgi:hypothetical protein
LGFGTVNALLYVDTYDFVYVFKDLDEGEDGVMRCFSELRIGVSQVAHYFPQEFGLDVVLDVFGIEVDYFEHQHRCMDIDLFLS